MPAQAVPSGQPPRPLEQWAQPLGGGAPAEAVTAPGPTQRDLRHLVIFTQAVPTAALYKTLWNPEQIPEA